MLGAFIAQTIFETIELVLSVKRSSDVKGGDYFDSQSCKLEVSTVFFFWLGIFTMMVRSSITSYTNYMICTDKSESESQFEMVFCANEVRSGGNSNTHN